MGLVMSGGWCVENSGRYFGPNPYVLPAPIVVVPPARECDIDYHGGSP
jgi:hypothetical protein